MMVNLTLVLHQFGILVWRDFQLHCEKLAIVIHLFVHNSTLIIDTMF